MYWSKTECYALLLIMYVSNIFSGYSIINHDLCSLSPTGSTASIFIKNAETYFGAISTEKAKIIQKEFSRYDLLSMYLGEHAKNELYKVTKHAIDFKYLKIQFPRYWRHFINCWNIIKVELSDQNPYLKYICLSVCISIFPIEEFYSVIKVFLCSDIGKLYENYLKQIISIEFKGKYNLEFVESIESCDAVFSTLPIDLPRNRYTVLVINSHYGKKDISAIDLFLNNFVK